MKNVIEIDLDSLPTELKKYVKDTIALANSNGIPVHLLKRKYVSDGGLRCSGFFSEDDFTVACNKPTLKWFDTFLHESCHMDQFLYNKKLWNSDKIKSTFKIDLFFNWLDGIIELSPEQLNDYMSSTRDIELDCEKRSVAKIKKLKLPMDAQDYARKANSYVIFYNAVAHYRKWYKVGKEPYKIPEIIEAMSDKMDMDYTKLTKKQIALYKICFE
jgi:hypothetical protein